MANKSFAFLADTINGKIQEKPVTVILKCNQVTPIGMQTVRDFDIDYCIVAQDVYLVLYSGDTFGTTAFNTFDEFENYMASQCKCCEILCTFTINCCTATINGCSLVFLSERRKCQLFINDCKAQINGNNLFYFSNN